MSTERMGCKMKRLVSIQDISDLGKCSLTAALPVISALGVECAVLPTAVLSTHTMFRGFTFHDLTDEMEKVADHWKEQSITFDAIYTGYLGSYRQIDIVKKFFADFGEGAKIIVDPAMADNGRLYTGFTPEFALKMSELCRGADIVLPNITEACFMLGAEYKEKYDRAYIEMLLNGLKGLGAKNCVLTGVSFEEGKLGAVKLNAETGEYFEYFTEKQPENFHGTGDLFSSAVAGAVVRGMSVDNALKLACDFTCESIRLTIEEENHNTYGVNFEQAIPYLLKKCGE